MPILKLAYLLCIGFPKPFVTSWFPNQNSAFSVLPYEPIKSHTLISRELKVLKFLLCISDTFLLISPSSKQMSQSAPCSLMLLAYVLSLMRETEFYTQVLYKQNLISAIPGLINIVKNY
jgi:hypothetical protein